MATVQPRRRSHSPGQLGGGSSVNAQAVAARAAGAWVARAPSATAGALLPPTVTSLSNVAIPGSAASLPAIGALVADRMGFATTRTRIHAQAGRANHYPPAHAWNEATNVANSRLCLLNFVSGQSTSKVLDGESPWSVIRTGFVGSWWLERGSMYRINNTNNSNSLTQTHCDTGSTSSLKTFAGYEEVGVDSHCMGPSWNGRYWPVTLRVSAGVYKDTTWDRELDVLGPLISVGVANQGGGDRISVDPTGQFLSLVTENVTTGGQDFHIFGGPEHPTPSQRFAPMPYGTAGYRWSSGRINPGTAGAQHWDWAKDVNGDPCAFIVGNSDAQGTGPIMVRAADGWKTFLRTTENAFGHTGHCSGQARDMGGTDAGGWAFVSEGSTISNLRTRPGYGQVVAFKLIPAATNGGTLASPQYKVYGYTEMGYANGTWPADLPPDEPWDPYATPSFDGRRVLISTALRQDSPGDALSYILRAA